MTNNTQAEMVANAKTMWVPIEKLKFDPDNVRLKHINKKLSPEEAEKTLREIGNVNELAHQILADGVVYDPLIVTHDYIVLEGNRRLAALRLLKREAESEKLEGVSKKIFAKIKSKVLPKNIDNKTLDLYLATIHVRGKKPWKLYNRNKHIFRLNKIHHVSYDDLADRLGMGKITIQRAVITYRLVLDYSRTFPDDKNWTEKVSYFDELYKRKDLKEHRENKNFLIKFFRWIHDGKFHDYHDLRKLNDVMMDGAASAEFEKHGFGSALLVLAQNDPTLSSKEFKRIKDTMEALKSISRTGLSEIKSDPIKMRYIYQLEAEVKSLIADLEAIKISNKN